MRTYGLVLDPAKTVKHNVALTLRGMPSWFYFDRGMNLECHNLCTVLDPPKNFGSILGLGLNFCLQQ